MPIPQPPANPDTSYDLHHKPKFIAKQAIVDATSTVVAYELFDRSQKSGAHDAASDVALIFHVLSHAGTEELIGHRKIFLNCTHHSLAGGHLELIEPDKVVLKIPPMQAPEPGQVHVAEIEARAALLSNFRQRGFQLAFGPSVLAPEYRSWQPLADFIKFDMSHSSASEVPAQLVTARNQTNAVLIAEKVETARQKTDAEALGFTLFQGYWYARPTVIESRLVSPTRSAAAELTSLVRSRASNADIEAVLKKDAGLAFNLMRLMNSSGFGESRKVTSFHQAVTILGLARLTRWSALTMLMAESGVPSPAASLAVVRGRLMELLVEESASPGKRDDAFVVGIFSLLDVMLDLPMADALALLTLPAVVQDALLHRAGPLGTHLALAEACETGNDVVFMSAANTLGLTSQQVNSAHLEALAWSDNIPVD